MAARLVNIDRTSPMLFLSDLREWIPDDYMVNFIIDAVAQLDLSRFKTNIG